jgi:hypothetical protein
MQDLQMAAVKLGVSRLNRRVKAHRTSRIVVDAREARNGQIDIDEVCSGTCSEDYEGMRGDCLPLQRTRRRVGKVHC